MTLPCPSGKFWVKDDTSIRSYPFPFAKVFLPIIPKIKVMRNLLNLVDFMTFLISHCSKIPISVIFIGQSYRRNLLSGKKT